MNTVYLQWNENKMSRACDAGTHKQRSLSVTKRLRETMWEDLVIIIVTRSARNSRDQGKEARLMLYRLELFHL